jgi:hypothetical protein
MAPMRDDDDRYSRANLSAHKSGGGTSVEGGERREEAATSVWGETITMVLRLMDMMESGMRGSERTVRTMDILLTSQEPL